MVLEANPYRSAATLAFLGSLVMMAALAVFAMRWIGWRPRVEVELAARSGSDATPAEVRLMRMVSSERHAQTVATALGRDLSHPAATGALFGVALLVPIVFMFGYGFALSWGVVTAVLMLLTLGGAQLLILLPFPPHVVDQQAPISRLLFLAAAAAAFLAVALQAALISTHSSTSTVSLGSPRAPRQRPR